MFFRGGHGGPGASGFRLGSMTQGQRDLMALNVGKLSLGISMMVILMNILLTNQSTCDFSMIKNVSSRYHEYKFDFPHLC